MDAHLGHGAVVQDLSGDVHVLHRVLQVGHEQAVAGLQGKGVGTN